MSEPIFERVLGDLEHAGRAVTAHLHHRELPSQAATTPEGTMTTQTTDTTTDTASTTETGLVADLGAKVDEIAQNVGGWFTSFKDEITAKVAPVAARVAKIGNSKILQAVEALAEPLDPGVEQMIARLISEAATLASKAAGDTTAVAAAPAPDAQPAPAAS